MKIVAAAFFSCSALMLTGCARNAFLELTLDLPPNAFAAKGQRYARVRVVAGEVDFAQDWQADAPIPAFPLDPTQRTTQTISIEGNVDNETTAVRVKINFCKDPNCAAIGDDRAPQAHLRIERAFYTGKRTAYTWSVECLPNAVDETPPPPACAVPDKTLTEVAKCGVSGCRTGVTTQYCVANKHFCED